MITSLQNCCLGFWQFETFDRKIEQRFIQQKGCKIHFFIFLRKKTATYVKELGDDYKRAIFQKEISVFLAFYGTIYRKRYDIIDLHFREV